MGFERRTILVFVLVVLPLIIILSVYVNNDSRLSSISSLNFDFNPRSYKSENITIIEELWKEIFTISEEQKLLAPAYLIKTMKFMIQDVDEDDPELIDFVKTVIVPPSKGPRNLLDSRSDKSQVGQSKFIDNLLGKKRNGFFIEAGGYDGESHSNSLFFEIERDWTGILIEPIPSLYNKLISKKRNTFAINACIADRKPFVAKFRVLHVLSGRENEMGDNHKNRVNKEAYKNGKNIDSYAYIPCFSLYTIMKALGVLDVDYFSLDVEGGEWSVIKSIQFDKINIKSFTIEWPGNPASKDLIINRLKENNFALLKDDGQDLYLKSNKFL